MSEVKDFFSKFGYTDDNTNIKNICLKLVEADTEENIIKILKTAGYWDNPDYWTYYGNNESNYSIIGNQQSAPESALVEKIINSVDACLMRECLRRGINPEGEDAPKTIKEAVIEFFNVKAGNIKDLTNDARAILAQNIVLTATGTNSNPCYSIIDKGEGQSPEDIPGTFLALTKSNKIKIPFVQGKFSMGGTGALRFCGKHNLQLIVSKRDPQIFEKNNKGKDIYWGFTVIRRDDPIEGVKFSSYKYLAPNGKILRFLSHELNLLPGQYPKPYEKPLEFGTFVKLYDYKLPSGLKTNILFDLNYRLAVLLPNLALPVTLYERREKYKGHTFNTLLSGLSVRLEQDPSSIIENGFPNSSSITLKGQEIKLQIYVFKKETETKHFKKDEGIIFTINGQSHGSISKSFFTRKSAGMSYLSESILIIADCSNLERRVIEDLFMNSRDRLSDGDLKKEIEEKLEYLIKNHQGLRELRERRLHDEASSKVEDEKPLVETIQNVIKNSPSLTKLFITGEKISIPFKGENAGTSDEPIKFKQYPTYFRLKKEYPRDKPKNGHINQKFRIFFETDARNDYFSRDEYPGEFRLSSNGNIIKEYSLNLWNGITSLSADLPEIDIGSIIEYDVVVNDQTQDKPFESKFFVIVLPEIEENPGGKGRRVKPPGGEGNKRERPARLELPKVIPVYEKEWGSHGFDRESGLDVIDAGEESGYLFYVNMDNIYLKTQIKEKSPIEPNILVKQYEYGMVLIGLSILRLVNEEEENVEQKALFDNIKKVTRAISPMLLPMINSLGELKIE